MIDDKFSRRVSKFVISMIAITLLTNCIENSGSVKSLRSADVGSSESTVSTPTISNLGTGCDNYTCLWLIGTAIDPNKVMVQTRSNQSGPISGNYQGTNLAIKYDPEMSVTLKLNAADRRLLAKNHRLEVWLVIKGTERWGHKTLTCADDCPLIDEKTELTSENNTTENVANTDIEQSTLFIIDSPDQANQENDVSDLQTAKPNPTEPQAATNPNLKYFGYYYSGAAINEVKDHVNLIWFGYWDWDYHNLESKLLALRQNDIKAVIDVSRVFYINPEDSNKVLADSIIEANIAKLKEIVTPYLDVVAMMYPHDEPYLGKYRSDAILIHSILDMILGKLDQHFPGVKTGIIYTTATLSSTFFDNNYNIDLNDGFDYVGFDCYPETLAAFFSCGDEAIGGMKSIPDWVKLMKTHMHAHQKIMLIPPSFVFQEFNQTEITAEQQQVANTIFDQFFFSIAETDSRVAAIIPFRWQNTGDARMEDKRLQVGARNMPDVAKHLRLLGKTIVNRN